MSDSPAPPAPVDTTAAAQATAAGNLTAAQQAQAANMTNQVTPYGNLTYSANPSSMDINGNPTYTATTTLSPDQQTLLDQQNSTSIGLGNLETQGLGYVTSALNNPVTAASLPSNMVNAGQTGQDALMARYQPEIDQSNAALQTQLANQGIAVGSEAYNNAMRVQNQSSNDLMSQAALNGISVGQDAQNQQLSLQTALQNQPLNMLNAVRTGAQVTNPTFGTTPTQATTAGPDYTSAANSTNSYNTGLYNSQVGSANSSNAATTGIASAALTAAAIF